MITPILNIFAWTVGWGVVFNAIETRRSDGSATVDFPSEDVDLAQQRLGRMQRGELISLFKSSVDYSKSSPGLLPTHRHSTKDLFLEGGLLNNGVVMSGISGFITDKLFSPKGAGAWAGKVLTFDKTTSRVGNIKGQNIFRGFPKPGTQFQVDPVSSSRIDGRPCVTFEYRAKSKSWFHPWCGLLGMRDEVREVARSRSGDQVLLLGLGGLGWGGGMLNCAPFCLRTASSADLRRVQENSATQQPVRGTEAPSWEQRRLRRTSNSRKKK